MKRHNHEKTQFDIYRSFFDMTFCALIFFVFFTAVIVIKMNIFAVELKKKKVSVTRQQQELLSSVTDAENKAQEILKSAREQAGTLTNEAQVLRDRYDSLVRESEQKKNEELLCVSASKKAEHVNRFTSHGGQPRLNVNIVYDESRQEIMFKLQDLLLSFPDFYKFVSCLDRCEEDNVIVFFFNMTFEKSVLSLSTEDLRKTLGMWIVTPYETQKLEQKNTTFIIDMLRKKYQSDFLRSCAFKKRYTTATVGNWERDTSVDVPPTRYEKRKSKKTPFLWFYTDDVTQEVLLGQPGEPLRLSPDQFSALLHSIAGADGFYVEHRTRDDLEGKNKHEVPDWVVERVIKKNGYECHNDDEKLAQR